MFHQMLVRSVGLQGNRAITCWSWNIIQYVGPQCNSPEQQSSMATSAVAAFVLALVALVALVCCQALHRSSQEQEH